MDAGSIDLIATDPPFNTGKDWGQFNDKWAGGLKGYLKFMEPRLVEMRRLLKDTGSFYLHCDTNASHYLKVMLDGIFGMNNFRNEIVWCYKSGGSGRCRFSKKHDTIYNYSKTDKPLFNQTKQKSYVLRGGNKNVTYYEDNKGVYTIVNRRDWWDDIGMIPTGPGCGRVGYPTQKPIALLERIIKASSNQGNVVLDPFCGSGTTLEAAKKLGRKYIGIDQNPEAIAICEKRLNPLQRELTI